MKVHHLISENSIASKFVAQLRDVEIQKDRLRFRKNMERLGEILAYEMSKQLQFEHKEIATPLGKAMHALPKDDIVICSILRAGLTLHQGILNYFDDADNSFISAYRHHPDNDENFEILVEYLASPSLDGKTLILADPMLATGSSFINVLKALESMGKPAKIHVLSVIGSQKGIENLQEVFPKDAELWIASIDEKLNSRGYIVPGLGDAGDLCYGSKMQS